jgi:hypothetical protein
MPRYYYEITIKAARADRDVWATVRSLPGGTKRMLLHPDHWLSLDGYFYSDDPVRDAPTLIPDPDVLVAGSLVCEADLPEIRSRPVVFDDGSISHVAGPFRVPDRQ